jgi:hypothetical protein
MIGYSASEFNYYMGFEEGRSRNFKSIQTLQTSLNNVHHLMKIQWYSLPKLPLIHSLHPLETKFIQEMLLSLKHTIIS